MTSYVELQITSSFSFLRGASNPDELAAEAFEMGYSLFGLTDRDARKKVIANFTARTFMTAQKA